MDLMDRCIIYPYIFINDTTFIRAYIVDQCRKSVLFSAYRKFPPVIYRLVTFRYIPSYTKYVDQHDHQQVSQEGRKMLGRRGKGLLLA